MSGHKFGDRVTVAAELRRVQVQERPRFGDPSEPHEWYECRSRGTRQRTEIAVFDLPFHPTSGYERNMLGEWLLPTLDAQPATHRWRVVPTPPGLRAAVLIRTTTASDGVIDYQYRDYTARAVATGIALVVDRWGGLFYARVADLLTQDES